MIYDRITTLARNAIDISGRRFGRLQVLYPVRVQGYVWRQIHWLCRCDCGVERPFLSRSLRDGLSVSCGCYQADLMTELKTKHGHGAFKKGFRRRSRTYRIWMSMRARCRIPTSQSYRLYGGRGVQVCERWDDFEVFLADVGEAPDGHSLDRIDTNGHYEPGNVRWATTAEQARNKRTNALVTINGVTKTITDWSQEYGLNRSLIGARINRGWSGADLLKPARTMPKRENPKKTVKVQYDGVDWFLLDLVRHLGKEEQRDRIYRRVMEYGWDIKRALFEPPKGQSAIPAGRSKTLTASTATVVPCQQRPLL